MTKFPRQLSPSAELTRLIPTVTRWIYQDGRPSLGRYGTDSHRKILDDHLVEGELETGEEIGIEIDQVLTQDTTGTMVWLQFEAMGLDEVQTEIAAQYCDHQTYQFDFKNTDDHRFLRSAAGTYGAHFSPEMASATTFTARTLQLPARRCWVPDSHTPTPAASANSPSALAGSTSPSRWAVPYYIEMPRSSKSASRANSPSGPPRRTSFSNCSDGSP